MEWQVKLKTLIQHLDVQVKGSKEIQITGLSADSRTVSPGNLFIAKKGAIHDGAQFVSQAINAGACAILTDLYDPFITVPQIIHANPGALEAVLAARYYRYPAKELRMIAVTGTKGKTTTTYLIKHLLDHLGVPCGLIGTVETIIGAHRFPSHLTTQSAIANQKFLREMVDKGCKAAVLEVSSHGLEQKRVGEILFDVGVFTNLYSDHLDYHLNVEAYAAAKKKLFAVSKQSVVNADSYWRDQPGLSFGIESGMMCATNISWSASGTHFTIRDTLFHSPLIGRFNLYNALAAITALHALGHDLSKLAPQLATFPGAPARLERIGNVFIDFAHTGEALDNVLQTLKEIAQGRLIVVFGCGGNRDPQRRTKMAKAADQWADIAIVTNDNPRHEDPIEIAKQIVAAFTHPPIVELDRKKAIEQALSLAAPSDLVLIAGKGHEKVQIFGNQSIPFDDIAVVKEALQNIGRSAILDNL